MEKIKKNTTKMTIFQKRQFFAVFPEFLQNGTLQRPGYFLRFNQCIKMHHLSYKTALWLLLLKFVILVNNELQTQNAHT